MIWFTSDNHFYHKNIIRLSNRPFADLTEMHEAFIEDWNKKVKPTELVYVIGDFSFSSTGPTKKIMDRLLGKKILIKGNHDMPAHKMLAAGFDEVHENIFIELGGHKVFLSHYPYHPMIAYGKYPNETVIGYPVGYKIDSRYLHKRIVDDGQSWLVHGHVHGAWKQNGRQINVGVDVWDYKLVSHEKLIRMIEAGPQIIGKSDADYGD